MARAAIAAVEDSRLAARRELNCRMVSAVIVAAGSGTRMGADKLFLEVAGLPVVGHTWRRFDAHPEIDEVVLVIRENARADFTALAEQIGPIKPHRFVEGGEERQDSVTNGLAAVNADCEWVAIQDGARPCTPGAAITATLAAARETGANGRGESIRSNSIAALKILAAWDVADQRVSRQELLFSGGTPPVKPDHARCTIAKPALQTTGLSTPPPFT